MRRLGSILAVAGAACSPAKGTYITIDTVGGVDVDEVRLYVGTSQSEPMMIDPISDQMQSGPAMTPVPPLAFGSGSGAGGFWELDELDEMTVDANGPTFALEPYKNQSTVTLIAVGFMAGSNHQPVPVAVAEAYDVPVATTKRIDLTMELAPALEVAPDGSTERTGDASATYVKVWSSSYGTCVLDERWDENRLPTRAFIIPQADPDCDGYTTPDLECDPYWYLSQGGNAVIGQTDCPYTLATGNGCYLGGPPCSDGGTGSGSNRPNGCFEVEPEVCIPQGECSDPCSSEATGASFSMCAGTTSVVCTVYADSATYKPCPSTSFVTGSATDNMVDLADLPGGMSNGVFVNDSCTDVWTLDGDTLTAAQQTPTMDEIDAGSGQLKFRNETGRCGFEVSWNGVPLAALGMQPGHQMIGFDLATHRDKQILVPLILYVEAQCPDTSGPAPAAISCTFMADAMAETLSNCTQ